MNHPAVLNLLWATHQKENGRKAQEKSEQFVDSHSPNNDRIFIIFRYCDVSDQIYRYSSNAEE